MLDQPHYATVDMSGLMKAICHSGKSKVGNVLSVDKPGGDGGIEW